MHVYNQLWNRNIPPISYTFPTSNATNNNVQQRHKTQAGGAGFTLCTVHAEQQTGPANGTDGPIRSAAIRPPQFPRAKLGFPPQKKLVVHDFTPSTSNP